MSVTRDEFLSHVQDCYPTLTPLAEWYVRDWFPTLPDGSPDPDGPGNVWSHRTLGSAVRDWLDQMTLEGEEDGVSDLLTRGGCGPDVLSGYTRFADRFPGLGYRPEPEPLSPAGTVLVAFSRWTQDVGK